MTMEAQSPRRILRIITRLNIGGPSIHATLLSTGLDPREFSTVLVVGEPQTGEGDLSALVDGPGVRMIRLKTLRRPLRPWADAVSLVRLLRIVWQERPHVIHTHMAKAGTLGRLAGVIYNRLGPGRRPEARAVLVHTFHGHVLEGYFSPPLSRFFIIIERWVGRRTDRLIAVSRTIQDELLKKGIGRPTQWQVIPVGLNLSILARVPLPNGSSAPIRIGMVGRLVPVKNPRLFLEALHRLARHLPPSSVVGRVVGDGPLRPELERQARRLGLDGLVQFTGWQQQIAPVYEGLDIVCLTSLNEGTPVALIEAMAAGRPVVSTEVGGVRDLLREPGEAAPDAIGPGRFHLTRRGILVRSGDAEGLAAALERLAQDGALRTRLGEAGRAYALRVFDHHRLIQDISDLYDGMRPQARGGVVPCTS